MDPVDTQAAALYAAMHNLLSVTTTINTLRQEIAGLRREVTELRRTTPPVLIPVSDAARRLGLSKKTVRRHIEQGLLRSVRIGNAIRVDLSSLPDALDVGVGTEVFHGRPGSNILVRQSDDAKININE